jgi:hypothetical protein
MSLDPCDQWPWPTDGLEVACFICDSKHTRKAGWGHRKQPICDACDQKLLQEVNAWLENLD